MVGIGFKADIGGSDARRFNFEDALGTLESAESGKEADAVTKDECGRGVTDVEDL
jgi:hypothetical protein